MYPLSVRLTIDFWSLCWFVWLFRPLLNKNFNRFIRSILVCKKKLKVVQNSD
jgi:hypothetical protein